MEYGNRFRVHFLFSKLGKNNIVRAGLMPKFLADIYYLFIFTIEMKLKKQIKSK